MPGFENAGQIATAELEGRFKYCTWRKAPTQLASSGTWFDASMSTGNPVPQYYAATPLTSVALARSTDGGIDHGGAVFPLTKHVRKVTTIVTTATAGTPMMLVFLDYLLFYSFIDEGTLDEQFLTNLTTLPRHVDGDGVRIMAVSLAARTGGQNFTCSYTNQDGVSGRMTKTATQTTASPNGTIVTSSSPVAQSSSAPFLALQEGDTGVRSIQSVTMAGTDTGLFALVLVKPICETVLLNTNAPVERDFLTDFSKLPVVADDAYLNFVYHAGSATLGTPQIHGDMTFIWN